MDAVDTIWFSRMLAGLESDEKEEEVEERKKKEEKER
jgi:hypothetical protein